MQISSLPASPRPSTASAAVDGGTPHESPLPRLAKIGGQVTPTIEQLYSGRTISPEGGYDSVATAIHAARYLTHGASAPAAAVIAADGRFHLAELERLRMLDGGTGILVPFHFEQNAPGATSIMLEDRDMQEVDVRRIVDGAQDVRPTGRG